MERGQVLEEEHSLATFDCMVDGSHLNIAGEVVVNHSVHALDVKTSCSNICCYKQWHSTTSDLCQCPLSLLLTLVSVDGTHAVASLEQFAIRVQGQGL